MPNCEGRITLFLYNKINSIISFHQPSGQLDHTNGRYGLVWCHSEAVERDKLTASEWRSVYRPLSCLRSLGLVIMCIDSFTPLQNHLDSRSSTFTWSKLTLCPESLACWDTVRSPCGAHSSSFWEDDQFHLHIRNHKLHTSQDI